MTTTIDQAEFIGTVDVSELNELRWPFMRIFARRFVEEVELGRYLKRLLATRRWTDVRVVPHLENGVPSTLVLDVCGHPSV